MSDECTAREPVRRPRRTRAAITSTILGLSLVVAAGVVAVARSNHGPQAHAGPTIDIGTLAPASPTGASAKPEPKPSRPARRAAISPVGATLNVARLQAQAPIVGVGVQNGELGVPQDPRTLGWWTGSSEPGSGVGSIVIDGHINYSGVSGTLAVLPKLRIGDTVTLTRSGQVFRYHVTAARTYVKSAGLPRDVFSRTGPERLALITCGGPFDSSTGNYEDNIVVYASP